MINIVRGTKPIAVVVLQKLTNLEKRKASIDMCPFLAWGWAMSISLMMQCLKKWQNLSSPTGPWPGSNINDLNHQFLLWVAPNQSVIGSDFYKNSSGVGFWLQWQWQRNVWELPDDTLLATHRPQWPVTKSQEINVFGRRLNILSRVTLHQLQTMTVGLTILQSPNKNCVCFVWFGFSSVATV